MLSQEQTDSLVPTARTAQVINGAMIMGLLVFGGVVVATTNWVGVKAGFSFLAAIAAGAALVMIVMSFIMPQIVNANVAEVQAHELNNKGEKQVDGSALKKFSSQFLNSHVIRLAMLEGGAFLNLCVFFVDKHWVSLGMVVLGLFALVLCFPTGGRVINWIENQVRITDEHLSRY